MTWRPCGKHLSTNLSTMSMLINWSLINTDRPPSIRNLHHQPWKQVVSCKTRSGIDEALRTWLDLYFDLRPGRSFLELVQSGVGWFTPRMVHHTVNPKNIKNDSHDSSDLFCNSFGFDWQTPLYPTVMSNALLVVANQGHWEICWGKRQKA